MTVRTFSDELSTTPLSRFVESLREPQTPFISLNRIAEALGVKRSSMAAIVGVHRNTLRNPTSGLLQERLREVIRIISAAAALSGDVDKALYWFRNEPIVDYDHRTAAQLVATGHADAVMTYLRDLENGANG